MESTVSKGHPKGLYVLFFSEMWERFCYYGMRGLLLVYLVDSLLKKDAEAAAIYGTYTALVYMAPVLGGRIADRFLGYKTAVIFGGILMALGEFLILGGTEAFLYLGMAAIIVGNGYFKANISSIVGKLYADGDPRRDAGFSIFYIGINIGALGATTLVAWVGSTYGYTYGFLLAGIGMILGVLIFVVGSNTYGHVAAAPNKEKLHAPVAGPLSMFHLILLGSLALIPALYYLITFKELMNYLLPAVRAYVVFSLISGGIKEGVIWRDRMIAMIIIFVFNIVFWACFEQAGSSLILFARRNVDRMIGGWEMPETVTQFFNPAFIILFGSIFSIMWIKLSKAGKNPNIPTKFGLGIIQLGLGYLLVFVGGTMLSAEYMIPLFILAFLYLLHTTGELFLSPIGLSMVTKLAPKHMTGTAMGGWFLSFAFSNYVAGMLASLAGVGGHGGGGGEKGPDPTFQQMVVQIEANAQLVKQKEADLALAAKDLMAKGSINTDDELSKNYPAEIMKLSEAVTASFAPLHDDLYSVIKDTSAYKGQAKLNWDVIVNTYHGGVKGILGSVEALTKATNELKDGKAYTEVKTHLAEAVVGIGEGYSALGSVREGYTKKGSGLEMKASEDALNQFESGFKRIASHVYWNIYFRVYILMGLIAVAVGILLVIVNKPINKLMHGVA